MRGAILVHALAAIPWAAFFAGIGLMQIDPAEEEAALLNVPPPAVLRSIVLPQLAPFLLGAAAWTTVGTTAEMTVTNIYLVSTYTEDFYNTFAATSDSREAAKSVLPGALSLAVLVVAALVVFSRLPLRGLGSRQTRALWPLDIWGWILAVWTWLVIGVLTAVPLGSLVYKAGFQARFSEGELQHSWSAGKFFRLLAEVPERFGNDAVWTVTVAALAATLATTLAVALAWQARRGGWRAAVATVVICSGLAVPGPLVGVALIWLLRRPIGPEITGGSHSQPLMEFLFDRSILAPVLAQAIRALPLATLLAWHSFRTIDRDVLAAASLDGNGAWRQLLRIALPQRRFAIAAAWLAALAIAVGDLAWSYLVLPPGLDMLQRRIFGLVHSGVEEQVASLSLAMIAMSTMLAVLILRLSGGPIALRSISRRNL
jgi:ABC-type Fe3+ transport system permease subunit